MTFALSGWMLYTMWAVLGLMAVDLIISFIRSLTSKTFSVSFILTYLRDILYYVLPLIVVANLIALDPTGWIMLILYYVGGISVIWNYLKAIQKRF